MPPRPEPGQKPDCARYWNGGVCSSVSCGLKRKHTNCREGKQGEYKPAQNAQKTPVRNLSNPDTGTVKEQMAELTKLSKQLAEMIGVKVDEKKKAEPAQEERCCVAMVTTKHTHSQ